MKMRDGLWQSKSGLGEDIKRGMEMHQKKTRFHWSLVGAFLHGSHAAARSH